MTSLSKWNPFEMTFPRMEEFFRLGPFQEGHPFFAEGQFSPNVSLSETPETYVVTAEVPGIPAEEIKVDLNGDRLTISGEKKAEDKREEEHMHVFERRYGSFSRTFTFPSPVDPEKVQAESADGVLKISVAKAAEGNGRRIEVKKTD